MSLSPKDVDRLRDSVKLGNQKLARKLLVKGGAAGKCEVKRLCFKVTGDKCSARGKWVCALHFDEHVRTCGQTIG